MMPKLSVFDASMRPPEFTGGNIRLRLYLEHELLGFNEAAGIHRRKPVADGGDGGDGGASFNEAAGIHRRKPTRVKSKKI